MTRALSDERGSPMQGSGMKVCDRGERQRADLQKARKVSEGGRVSLLGGALVPVQACRQGGSCLGALEGFCKGGTQDHLSR